MRIIVSAQGGSLDAPASPFSGRCPTYILVDTETAEFEAFPNPAVNQGGGTGIQAAQFVVEQGAQAILTGNLGPNAFDVLQAAGIAAYLVPEGAVRQAVEAFKARRLQPIGSANIAAHAGMGGGAGRRSGMGAWVEPAGDGGPAAEGVPGPEATLTEVGESLKDLRRQLAETMTALSNWSARQTQRGSEPCASQFRQMTGKA